MLEKMTLEQFVQEHPEDIIQIMSPSGYVTIGPDRQFDKLFAHAGVRGTEVPISWEELKGQTVDNCNFNTSDGYWYLITDISQDYPTQTLGM